MSESAGDGATIFALSTAGLPSAIAIVRTSGPASHAAVETLIGRVPEPRSATLALLCDPVTGEAIDRGIVLWFPAPASATGEDMAEFHVHGSPAIIRQMLAVLAAQSGCRLAQPGEFTRRAFENGKLDLTEAEAIADLINAETVLQKSQALSQLEGHLSRVYENWAQTLKKALAHLEADLEFPDEDMPEGVAPALLDTLQTLQIEIAAHLNDNKRGERLRDGIRIAVMGAPNAGKSSLVNALAKRDIAIVSEQAGTTRDVIEVHLDLGGYPVILADTAGLRPDQLSGTAQDAIESEGIRRALERAQQADIRLLLFDATVLPQQDSHTKALINENALILYNKKDAFLGAPPPGALMISAKSGDGLDDFLVMLIAHIEKLMGRRETPSLTRARHREALVACHEALGRALTAPLPELTAEDTRLAIRALGSITGHVDVEDLLDVIFRDFCIGK